MPYIHPHRRLELEPRTRRAVPAVVTPGELSYLITRLLIRYLEDNGYDGLDYRLLNDVCGALTEAKAEFERRIVGPYEDKKMAENGDVYGSLITRWFA